MFALPNYIIYIICIIIIISVLFSSETDVTDVFSHSGTFPLKRPNFRPISHWGRF
ncbi:MAG: hypothetical protein Q8881_04380 [Sweet potato little leaf phytoplasma]|nr:hypothetical protein [Sweet potato little leaf phytoplasma]